MSRLLFTDAADRVKSSLDIVDVIQRHVILKKSGRNYMGKCPFHNDKSPSMNVSREKGIFKCFSCGVGGDALSFLMRLNNKTYGEVIRELAQDQGIDIIYEGQNADVVAAQKDTRQKILELNAAAARWFQERLTDPTAQPVLDYVAGRYPDEALRAQALSRFEVGYAPPGWENLTPHLKTKFDFIQANPDLLVTSGLANSREHGQGHYDRFRHRLIIPIHDEKGQVVAFGGRALVGQNGEEDKPKYLNSPETIVYHKSNVLYGFYQAREAIRQQKAAVVMEGYFDVMTAHLAGVTEAVGSCGTAMTDSHLKLLTRFGAETVYLAFDSDEAGLKAAMSAISLIEPYMGSTDLQLKVLIVPNGKDPDDFIRQQGGEAFRGLMRDASNFLVFKFDMAIRGLDIRTSEGRIQAANRLTPLLGNLHRPSVRAEYLKTYAEKIGISEEALALEVKRYEQSQPGFVRPVRKEFQDFGQKKAISKYGSTSFKRQQPIMTDNLSELRQNLSSRQATTEKNLLRLFLYNSESLVTMMRFVENQTLSLTDPLHQELLAGLCNVASGPDFPETDPSDNGILGTLIDRMNHLYLDKPDMCNTFAELVLTAEAFGDSLGLNELQGTQLREKVEQLAEQHVQQLAHCRKTHQLQAIKTNTLQNEGDAIALTHQFHAHLRPAVPAESNQAN